MEYDEKKHSYDSTALQLQSNMSKVEGEVKSLREEMVAAESKHLVSQNQKLLLEATQERVSTEIKLYVSNSPEDKKKSLREKLLKAIADAEKQAKALKEEQRTVREAVNDNAKQTKMWGIWRSCLSARRNVSNRAWREEEELSIEGLDLRLWFSEI